MNQLQFQNISIKDIFPDPNQPRKFYDESAMNELIQSVKESCCSNRPPRTVCIKQGTEGSFGNRI